MVPEVNVWGPEEVVTPLTAIWIHICGGRGCVEIFSFKDGERKIEQIDICPSNYKLLPSLFSSSPSQDHLVCNLPGTLALAIHNGLPEAHVYSPIATNLMRTCYEMYERTATGLSPEIIYLNMAVGSESDFLIMV